MKKLAYVPIAIMFIVGLLMIGITDYLTSGLSFERFSEPEFWNNIITSNIGIICLIVSILLLRIDKFKEENKDYLQTVSLIAKFYIERYIAPVFRMFTNEQTLEYKKEAYLTKIQKKYNKLKPSAKDLEICYGKDEEAKVKNKYYRKEKRLAFLMSKEYIDENIHKINIKHNTITDSLIFSGVPTSSKHKDYIHINKGLKILLDLLPKFLMSFAIIFITTAVAIDFKEGIDASVVFKTASKIFSIATQWQFANTYSKRYNVEVTLGDAQFRLGLLTAYPEWEKRNEAKLHG